VICLAKSIVFKLQMLNQIKGIAVPPFICKLEVVAVFISPKSILKRRMSFYRVLNPNDIKVLDIKVDLILSALRGDTAL
jgi:hypothetical protein